ncbi:hypothetical protein A3207_00635 [Candidatus Methanomassiliicoccus intestinalis]|uniref:DNA helicase n=2 Tax=Candidatus Methanomassiliicoccus intestinalis TaxID=1406512 RepID=R9T9M0_METII|nr:minichromosome maintenance protein MCM [Candidatus Methanomassiliicoccus intestinalis]AGN26346.1 Minichromosome maintenance (MCM) protein [Candidatus Methanomassiliicoccus intestinalis Issoire-Mx1]TQS84582.1 MAG: hypothetical protein A3207_00635 [Candidatus Methanomassiliicoccus intestinalis]
MTALESDITELQEKNSSVRYYTQEDASLESKWESFLTLAYTSELSEIVAGFPNIRSVYVDFSDLDKFDPDLASAVLEDPDRALDAASRIIKKTYPLTFGGLKDELHVRITSLPNDVKIPISHIRTCHLGDLISVEGIIRKSTAVKPYITESVYQCRICGNKIHIIQDDARKYTEPTECPRSEDGCGKAGAKNFKLLYKETAFLDNQKIEIQEAPDSVRSGAQPASIIAYLDDDAVGSVTAGDRVTLNGILRAEHKSQAMTPQCDLYLDVLSVETQQDVYEEIEITDDDIAEIKTISQSPTLYKDLVASVSTTICGYDVEKLALVLQLFGGVPKTLDDGSRVRGDIHILLIGDPGVAKSQMLRYIAKMSPRGIYASGKSSTSAGLCATAVKDDFGEGRWTLEAGALVLADQGNACIDEMDKMRDEDRSSMHEAMESQTISIAKAGITAQLNSRASVLGAANPKFGRFEDTIPFSEQIDMPPALLSRFDLIFVIIDKPDEARDRSTSTHIISTHRRGSARQQRNDLEGVDLQKILNDTETLKPVYDRQIMRKYIAYAKNIFPVLTDKAADLIQDAYMKIRQQGYGNNSSVPITARQLEAYIRLAEASARARLSNIATEEDAQRAISLIEYYLQKIAGQSGTLDIDHIATGITKQKRNTLAVVSEIIHNFESRTFSDDDVLENGLEHGIPAESISNILASMCKLREIRHLGGGIYERLR